MCFKKDKWQKFEPTKQYLSIISGLTSISKLHLYSQKFKYIAEKGDHWKTPVEFMNDGGGDCEDWARWYVDILMRAIKQDKARFICYSGYNTDGKLKGHAICVLLYRGKLAIFSSNRFFSGFNDYIEIGHKYYPKLKSMEVRDWQGKILEKKRKWIGVL